LCCASPDKNAEDEGYDDKRKAKLFHTKESAAMGINIAFLQYIAS
jgi:hypothetical protein